MVPSYATDLMQYIFDSIFKKGDSPVLQQKQKIWTTIDREMLDTSTPKVGVELVTIDIHVIQRQGLARITAEQEVDVRARARGCEDPTRPQPFASWCGRRGGTDDLNDLGAADIGQYRAGRMFDDHVIETEGIGHAGAGS